ncbi:MAG TPA: discoidin domain-containing protein [Vicinamibacteria bacterium]|nr:discoidin domain-containing protein [Vicinamibacteria bacterium]
MIRALSATARALLAVLVGLLVLSVLRWPPVWARPLLDVRALALAGPAVVAAVVAALASRPATRTGGPVRPVAVALGGALALLALVVALRPAAGLAVAAFDPRGPIGVAPAGAIDVAGPGLRHLPATRKWTLRWEGELRAPRRGLYRLWATGRGDVVVVLDGHVVLRGGGDPLRAAADVPIVPGPHVLEVTLSRTGPGPRLRLGWTWPAADGRAGGYDEVILPRDLGRPIARAWWWATDTLALAAAVLAGLVAWRWRWDLPRRLPLPRPMTAVEVGWSLAGHALVVAAMSWPLVRDLAGQGVTDRPDGRLNAWILAWDAHALLHAPLRLFQAPIFHPLPDTLAFSENLLLPGLLGAPFQAGGPVLAYNVVLLLSLVVSGLGVQLLVRRVSGDPLAAFVAGAFFAAGAHRWIRLAHLHAQVTLFLPLILLALDRFWARRTLGRAALVGLLLALQGLSSVYLGAIATLWVAVAVALGLLAGLRARELARLGAGLALAALLLAPVARPYLDVRALQGVEFTIADVASYATTLESYAASGTRLYGPLTQKHLDPERVQDTLFPGLTVLVLGLAGLASAPSRYRWMAVAASAAAVVFSLGPETGLYRLLHEHVVFVRGVRALSRFSLVAVMALCVLAGLALARRRRVAVAAAFVLFAVESTNVPLRYGAATAPSAAARWLAGRPGAVVSLPLGEGDTQAMLDGIAHWRPLVNGDSGFMPRPYTREMELLELPLRDEALRLLRAVDVAHVVAREDLPLPVAFSGPEERVYEVPPGEAARVPPAGTPVPTVWRERFVTADLGTPRPVSSVVFEVSEAPWIEEPVVEVSADGAAWTRVPARASLADATLALLRDPRHGAGEVTFPPATARFVRLSADLPARAGALQVR